MDAMFNVFGFGMSSPEEKYKFFEQKKEKNIADQEEKRGIFWANRDKDKPKPKSNLSNFDFTSMGGTGPLDQKGKQILPSDKNYPGRINQMQTKATTPFDPSQGGTQQNLAGNQDMRWWEKLGNMAGVDMTKAAAQWKDKGGFEGLMANPAFTMGLAFMQAGAEGKTLGQGALNNVMKAAGVSSHYKRLMEAKAGGVTEVTTGQMDQIKSVLGTKGISAPILRKLLPGNQSEMYQQAVEDIAFKVQKKVSTMKAAAKASGKDIEVGTRLYKKVIDSMIASGEISTKGGINIGGYQLIDRTLETKAQGGPVAKGKPYVVGEGGPEYFLPKESGKVLSNDDTRIFAMLLAANPQLQNVSKTRSEKILRNRFPEYFE